MAKPQLKQVSDWPKPALSAVRSGITFDMLAFFDRHGAKIFLGACGVMLGCLYNDYLFGNWLYLFDDSASDTINVFYPNLFHVADYLHTTGLPAWSFNQGIGQNIFPNALGDPFNWLLYATGAEHLADYIAWVEVLKLLLGGFFFYKYLRVMGLGGYVSVMGGLLFSFSGFALIGSKWYSFSSNLPQFALLLLGFELFFQQGRWWVFALAVALLSAVGLVNLYVYAVFMAVYFLVRYWTAERAKGTGDFALISLKLTALGIIGLALSAVFWLPALKEIWDSPGGKLFNQEQFLMQFPFFGLEGMKHYGSVVLRSFANEMVGTSTRFSGWRNYLESPMNYCGLLALLMAPQVFVGRDKRARLILAGLFALLILPQIFPFLRYAFWQFSGDYYRNFSHLFGTAMQLFALVSLFWLVKEQRLNVWLLAGTLAALLGLLYFPWGMEVLPHQRIHATCFLLGEAAFLFMAARPSTRNIALTALPFALIAELYISSVPTAVMCIPVTRNQWAKGYYHDKSWDAVRWIQKQDSSFYRITKKFGSGATANFSNHDAKVQRFFGNTNDDTYHQYLSGAKYTLAKTPLWEDTFIRATTDSLGIFGDVRVLREKLAFPFGVTYDKFMRTSEFLKLEKKQQAQSSMVKAVNVRDEDLSKLEGFGELPADSIPNPGSVNFQEMAAAVAERSRDSFELILFSQNHITGSIHLNRKKLLQLSLPLDDDWAITVDGQLAEPILANFTFVGIVLEPGQHTVEMTYHIPWFKTGTIVSLSGLLLFFTLFGVTRFRNRQELNAP